VSRFNVCQGTSGKRDLIEVVPCPAEWKRTEAPNKVIRMRSRG